MNNLDGLPEFKGPDTLANTVCDYLENAILDGRLEAGTRLVERDLAEKFNELITELETVDYGTLPESTVLQTISIILIKECRKKDILKLPRKKIIDIWPVAADAIKSTVEYFRNAYRIPVSRLLPYPNLVVPFAYYF